MTAEHECCPQFNPDPWDEKTITWENKVFIKDRVRSFLHMPLNFGAVMRRNCELIKASGVDMDDVVVSDENSLWGADVYIGVRGEVRGAQMTTISGTFLSKVFEGPYSQMRNWIEAMKSYVGGQDKALKRLLFFYTTCPKCAKKYGKNYVVLLAEV